MDGSGGLTCGWVFLEEVCVDKESYGVVVDSIPRGHYPIFRINM